MPINFRAVDDLLPKVIHEGTQNILSMLGFLMVVAFVNPYFLVAVFIVIILFFFIRKTFMATSLDLRQLDGIRKQINKFVSKTVFK